jgi:hypothetical protein
VLRLVEPLEDAVDLVRRDPAAVILHADRRATGRGAVGADDDPSARR